MKRQYRIDIIGFTFIAFLQTFSAFAGKVIESGQFRVDSAYPKASFSNRLYNFATANRENISDRSAIYYIISDKKNIFEFKEKIGADRVCYFITPCSRRRFAKSEIIQRPGGEIEPIFGKTTLERYGIDKKYTAYDQLIYIPIYKDLSNYFPRSGSVGYLWMVDGLRESNICVEYGASRMYGPSYRSLVNISNGLYVGKAR